MLPTDYNARKKIQLHTFLTEYFPDAITELVRVSVAGNEQHNPGERLHWARGKSTDQLNTAQRHLFDHVSGIYDESPPEVLVAIDWEGEGYDCLHLAKAAWRLLAEIQLICESRRTGVAYNGRVYEGPRRGVVRREEGSDAPGPGQASRQPDYASGHFARSGAGRGEGEAR